MTKYMKNLLKYAVIAATLLTFTACGGGGGNSTTPTPTPTPTPAPSTTALLKINLTGTLPASAAIAGADFILTLPANVTPNLANGSVATGVVANSCTFAGRTIAPQVVYTAATASAAILRCAPPPSRR